MRRHRRHRSGRQRRAAAPRTGGRRPRAMSTMSATTAEAVPRRRRGPRRHAPDWSPSTTTPLNTPSTCAIGVPGHHAGVHPLLQPGSRRHPRHAQELDPVAELGPRRRCPSPRRGGCPRCGSRRSAAGRRRPARPGAPACARRRCRRRRSWGRPRRSPGLRLGEHVGELAPGLAHRGQDEVAGAVEDAVDPRLGCRPALAQRLDDRDAARDRGLERQRRRRSRPAARAPRRGGRASPCWR